MELEIVRWPGWSAADAIPGTTDVHYKAFLNNRWRTYDLIISSEFHRTPGWQKDAHTLSAYALHGVGPKVSYFAREELRSYDAVFCPGPVAELSQRPFVASGAQLLKTGLPVTDFPPSEVKSSRFAATSLFSNSNPILLYAPTWTADPSILPMTEQFLRALARTNLLNVLVAPHPLLLKPSRCGGKDWGGLLATLQSETFVVHAGAQVSIYDVLAGADLLVGDMSSVVFEFLPLGRPLLQFMRRETLDAHAAGDLADTIRSAADVIEHPSDVEELAFLALGTPKARSPERADVASRFLYNIGHATRATADAIYDLTGARTASPRIKRGEVL